MLCELRKILNTKLSDSSFHYFYIEMYACLCMCVFFVNFHIIFLHSFHPPLKYQLYRFIFVKMLGFSSFFLSIICPLNQWTSTHLHFDSSVFNPFLYTTKMQQTNLQILCTTAAGWQTCFVAPLINKWFGWLIDSL